MKGDLHCHTKLSDGSVGLEELIMLAAKRGVEVISIMDVDCLAGTVRGKMIGKDKGVEVVPGVDISATDAESGREVHILCYQPDFPDRLEGLCYENQQARKRASQIMMFKTVSKFGVTSEFITKRANGSSNLYLPHIMHALVEAGYADRIYGDLYRELFTEGKPGAILTRPKFRTPEEVIDAIHEAGGLAVYANPVSNGNDEILQRLLPMLDGVEAIHPACDETTQARLLKLAKDNKLLVTGGTDFRGLYNEKPIQIGDCSPTEKQLDEFLNYKARKKRQQKRAENKAAAALLTTK